MPAPETIYWRAAPPRLDLGPGDLHLWRIRTDHFGADVGDCMRQLASRQQARASRMRHLPYRERYVRAQAGLRRILSRYLDAPPQSIRFDHGPAGKPMLPPDSQPLCFNLTTTGDLALVGVSAGRGPDAEVGVDCERIRPRRDITAVAERMFKAEVVQALGAARESERLAHFYLAWTALEADAKADGRGLFRPRDPGARPPTVVHCIPETGYVAAVAREILPMVCHWSTNDMS